MGISREPEYSVNSVVELRTNQIRPLKSLFESIKNNLPDTSIFFMREGMKILQLDTTGTFLVNVNLQGENFEHYYCNPGDKQMIEVNVSSLNLNQVFKSTTNDDNVLRFVYEKDSDVIQMIISSEKKTEYRTYLVPIQSPEDVNYGEISGISEFPYSLTMPSADLQRICRDFKAMSCEKITISHDGESLKFSCDGTIKTTIERRGKTVAATDASQVTFIKTPADRTYSDVFKFSTLNDFSKCQSGGDTKIVRIMLNPGEPMVWLFEIGTLGEMAVAIAPHQEMTQ